MDHPPTMEEYRFYRLYSMDLGDAVQTLELLSRIDDPAVRIRILRDAIVTYARPFSQNLGKLHRRHQLTEEFVRPEHRALHAELMDLRDKAFAHTDHDFKDPTVTRWHAIDGRSVYWIRFRVTQWEELDRRVPEITALVRAVELSVEGWIAWFEQTYHAIDAIIPAQITESR